LELVTLFTEDFFDVSSERFFFLPVLKSVSYHPEPLSLNEGAEISFQENPYRIADTFLKAHH
jgi:hypothetical protein